MHKGVLVVWGILGLTKAYAAERIYHHSESGAPRTLDPAVNNTTYANSIITAVYDTLYEYRYLKRPYELKPLLAARMPSFSKDGLTLTIPLRRGVYFTDDPCFAGGKGRELVAADVIYTFKRHFDPRTLSAGKWLWQDRIVGLEAWARRGAAYEEEIAGLRARDPYTLEVKLARPFPQFLYSLATGFAAIVPSEAVAFYGKNLAFHPVGSGPWRLKSFNQKKAELVRNPSYRQELFDLQEAGYNEARHGSTGIGQLAGRPLPLLDRIDVHFMAQESARWQSFLKGDEVQFAGLPSLELDRVVASKKEPLALQPAYAARYHFTALRDLGYVYTEFNMAHPAMGGDLDPRLNERKRALRCAIRKAFDWEARIAKLYYGLGQPFPGIIPPDVEGFDPSLSDESVRLDVAGAKKLLQEAGWNASNLPVFEYASVATVKDKQVFEEFRAWLVRIGYPREKVTYKTFASFGDYAQAMKDGRLMIHTQGWSLDYPDAENTLQLYYGPNKSPGSNAANYQNPAYDSLYAQAAIMPSSPQRNALYRQANELLIEDCVTIAGFARTRINLWPKHVIMFPDTNVVGNFFKYVDLATPAMLGQQEPTRRASGQLNL